MIKKTIIPALIFSLTFSFLGAKPVQAATDIVNDGTLSSGLQGCWELDEASGTRNDSHANVNHLSATNAPANATGVIGSAVDLEVGSTQYLSRTDGTQTGLDFTSGLTLAAWVNVESVSGATRRAIISKYRLGVGDDGNNGFAYYFFYNGTGLNLYLWDGTNFPTPAVTQSLGTGAWHHVAVTWDDTNNRARFYYDGAQVGADVTATAGNLKNSTGAFAVGAAGSAVGAAEESWDGLIDVAAVWNKEMTSTDISALYNAGAGIPCVASGGASTPQTPPPALIFQEG